jgi:hypothetical protein
MIHGILSPWILPASDSSTKTDFSIFQLEHFTFNKVTIGDQSKYADDRMRYH